MKKTIKVGGLVLICSSVLVVNNAFSAEEICCSEGLSPQQCCESNYGAWCSAKGVCVPYDEYCDYLCSDHARSYNCACANVSIYVSSPKASEQPYCCAKGETLQSCCQALGFTWVGPTVNTGKCSAPDPVACFKYISRVYYGESSWGEPSDRCCDTGSEADCCASFGGYWCDINKTCYQDIYLEEFAASPCMTPQMCESEGGIYCTGEKTCYYDDINYYENCPDVDGSICKAGHAHWCTSLSKCIYDSYRYLTTCNDDPETMCKDTMWGAYWCPSNNRCYTGHPEIFYLGCPDVDETLCKRRTANRWCSKNNRCYYYESSYNSGCK